MSVGNCGGLQVPYRAGRIDATEAGPFGVPAPETSLEETLEFFGNAGFDAVDSIGLTACGHSLGRVHHGGFPQVVPESAVTPNNTAGGINLDTTPANFDIDIVEEYLGGYGQRGGPLVTSDNVTVRSDLRLYESDNNATMKQLAQSKGYFFATCTSLFERMINTVPKEVQLTDVIRAQSLQPFNTTLDLDSEGTMKFSGTIRVSTFRPVLPHLPLTSSQYLSTAAAPPSLTISLLSSHGVLSKATVQASPNTGSNIWGTSSFYPFSFSLNASSPTPAHFSVSGAGRQSATYAIQAQTFFVPSLSRLQPSPADGSAAQATIVAAVFGNADSVAETDVSAVVSSPSPQEGTLAPKTVSQTVHLQARAKAGAYTLFSGVVTIEAGLVQGTSVDVKATTRDGQQVLDEYNHFGS